MTQGGRLGTLGVAAALSVGLLTPTPAAGQSDCTSDKIACVREKQCRLLRCHRIAERQGVPLDLDCLTTVVTNFNNCMAAANAQGDCVIVQNDTALLESIVDTFVSNAVQALDPGYPAVVLNKCSARKKQCVCKKARQKLNAHRVAVNNGVPVDVARLAKAEAKFVPCFLKAESKPPCLTLGDAASLEALIDQFIADVLDVLL
jgi:hypothetical protein